MSTLRKSNERGCFREYFSFVVPNWLKWQATKGHWTVTKSVQPLGSTHLFPWFISRWTLSLLTLLCCAYAWAKYACIFWSQTDPGSLRVFFDSQFSILWSFLAPQAIFCSYAASNRAKTMFSMHFPAHNRLKTVKNFPPAAGYCIFPVRYDRPAEWKSPLTKVCVSAEQNITYRRPYM